MNLTLTPDQTMMREEAERFLTKHASSPAMRAVVEKGDLRDDALWSSIAREFGWCGVAIPEAYGGLGLGAFDLALLIEQAGRRLACTPFLSVAGFAAPLLLHAAAGEAQERFLPAIASGDCIAAVAWPSLAEPGALDRTTLTAGKQGSGYRLSGTVAQVVDLAGADLVLAVARLEDGAIGLFAVPGDSGWRTERLRTLDATRPLARLDLDNAPAERIDRSPGFEHGFDIAVDWATLMLAAEQLGAAQGCFDLTLAYISDRVQFGRTIASFQAIKHRCAALAVDIEVARALVLGAAASLDSAEPQSTLDVSSARIAATEALMRCAEESIQLHGGVGFTWEYDPHFYLKRAQASSAWFGSCEQHLNRIADHLLGDPIDG